MVHFRTRAQLKIPQFPANTAQMAAATETRVNEYCLEKGLTFTGVAPFVFQGVADFLLVFVDAPVSKSKAQTTTKDK